jgi:tetratricopeptide (TPR) repeat protein
LQGRWAEARDATRRSLELMPQDHPLRAVVSRQLQQCERMLALEARLPAVLVGKERPAGGAECLEFAALCLGDKRYAASARFYADAFAADPKLADPPAGHRYTAALAAALAAAGKGNDAATLDDKERARWRQQALDWLRADLVAWTKVTDRDLVQRTLRTWQRAPDLAGVRDPEALAKLPEDERKNWQQFWAEVEGLLAADPWDQGRVYASLRQWRQAADCYTRALKHRPTDEGHFWFEYAAVLLLSGDRKEYARACARMIERCGRTGTACCCSQAPDLRPYHVARACTLAPDAVTDPALPGRLAEKELTSHDRKFWSLTEQGALYYRAGRFREAVPLLERSLRADTKDGRAVLNWLWLALAYQRLEKPQEARRWLDKAKGWLDQYGDGLPSGAEEELGLDLHNWLEAHVLRAEAETLLGPAPAK